MLNLFAMPKAEQKSRSKFRCVHRHNGFAHPNCYDQANGITEKICYLDIEATSLKSDFGVVLSYCLKEDNGKIISRVLTPKEIRDGTFDKELLAQFCNDIRGFNRIITYYGTYFDIPFLRSRCVYWSLDFPIYKELYHTDCWRVVKRNLGTLHSRRLGVVAPFFGIKAKEHPLNPEVWIRCLSGDKDALDFVLTHNKEDVISLEKLWHKIQQYTRLSKTSI